MTDMDQMVTAPIPNDWMSNTALMLLVPITTTMVMRIRNGMCKRSPSLRTKHAVDLSYILVTNILSLSSIVLWCTVLHLSFEDMMAIDILISIGTERWLIKVITSYDGTSYHPGGAIGKNMIRQRMRLSCILANVVRGYSAAATVVMVNGFGESDPLAEATTCVLLPVLYSIIRTTALDIDAYHPGAHTRVEVAGDAPEFTITDEEEALSADDDTAL